MRNCGANKEGICYKGEGFVIPVARFATNGEGFAKSVEGFVANGEGFAANRDGL